MSETKKALHVQVAEKLIEALKAGTAPWQKPWRNDGLPVFELPYNALTGNRYKGINTLSLILSARDDPRWLTFKQAADNGWQVRKGEKASMIQFVKLTEQRTKRDEQGKPLKDAEGKPVKVIVKLDRPVITSAWVFNAEQVDGIPQLVVPDRQDKQWQPIERAEALINASGAEIIHQAGDRAYYNVHRDHIRMPLMAQFDSPDKYYATLLHELGHWSGNKERLNRALLYEPGEDAYAREELRAEIASMLTGQELRIGHDPGQHTAYVDSWIQVLTDHPFEIISAAADAEKILNYLLGFEHKRDLSAKQFEQKSGNFRYLSTGDEIAWKDKCYKVLSHIKQGRLKMLDQTTDNQFIISKKDGLYFALLEAKNTAIPLQRQQAAEPEQKEQEQHQPSYLKR